MSASAFTLRRLVRQRAGQAVGRGRRAVRRVQGAAAAGPPGDARRPDAVAGRHGGARAGLRARGDARRRRPRRRGRLGRFGGGAAVGGGGGGVGAPSDLQAPRGAAAARRVLGRPVGADHDRGRRRRGVRRLRVAAADERDGLRLDRRAPGCRSPSPTARWGSSSRSREFAAAGLALLARAPPLPAGPGASATGYLVQAADPAQAHDVTAAAAGHGGAAVGRLSRREPRPLPRGGRAVPRSRRSIARGCW